MKKVLVAAFALVSLTASAQKGTLLVAGNVSLETSKSPDVPNDEKSTSFDFNPTVGYQFNDNWTAGVVAEVGTTKNTSNTNVVTKYSSFGVGPFVRYTQTLSNIFSLYGQLQGVFGTSKVGSTKVGTSTAIALTPAAFINLKNGFGLNFDFGGLGFSSTKPTGGSASTGFGVTFGKTMNIGIQKNFSLTKKK
ncbi:porin family protein [Ferruginibacter lapsinanis]|uniref:porin family protein n=1 Tax=Ferruginibacter lapsinanis TaxID=563172 RepID=UPI001E4D5E26|nr:porin family protein [Ferruginibacter lapsinanis]UEG49845.1 porin family protein [Ferruginibacter lapsinanis]